MDAIRSTPAAIPTAPPPPRSNQEPADRVELGVTRATLLVPDGDGGYRRVRKFSLHRNKVLRPADGGAVFLERADQNRLTITRASRSGDVSYRVPLDVRFADELMDNRQRPECAYVLSREALICFDPSNGQVTNGIQLPQTWEPRKLRVEDDGSVLLMRNKQVQLFDAWLNEQAKYEFPFEVINFHRTPSGAVVGQGRGDFNHMGLVEVRNAAGEVTFTNDQISIQNLAILPDGRVASVGYDYGKPVPVPLRFHDPATGDTVTVAAEEYTHALYAQPDGSLLGFARA